MWWGVKTLSQDDVKAAVLAALNEVNRPGERVVSTWKSAVNWYRVWSDGWIEQGGIVNVTAHPQTATLNKRFSNTNYTIVSGGGNGLGSSATTVAVGSTTCYDRTVSTFKAWTSDDASWNAGELIWYACGY